MAEVVGVVSGAVGTADAGLRWLGAIRQVLRDFRDAGEKLQMLYEGINNFRTGLEHWAHFWGIDPHVPKSYFLLLWGPKGGDLILGRLSIIGKKHEDFDNTMAMFLSEDIHTILASPVELDFDLQTLKPLPKSSKQQALHRREVEYLVKKKLTPVAKANFVFRKAREMEGLLSFLNASLETLYRDATRYFSGSHQNLSEPGSLHDPVNSVTNTNWIRSIVESREASIALHNCCFDGSDTVPTKIDLDLRPPKPRRFGTSDQVCTLQYHLIVEDESDDESIESEHMIRHVLIEWPISRPQKDITKGSSPDKMTFTDACEQLRTASIDESFGAYFVSELKWFSARRPPDSILYSNPTFKDLTVAWKGIAEDGFPFSERIELAYQIATCGVMLLGTPWLSSIANNHIVLSVDDGSPTRFYLKTDRESHRLAQKISWSIGGQIYMMGIVLLEIALARPVLGTGSASEKIKGNRRNRKDIKLASFNEELIPTWYTFAEVFQKIKQRAGRRYMEAVEYCLENQRHGSYWRVLEYSIDDNARMNASCDAVAEYCNTVARPLERLRKDFISHNEGLEVLE